ncbi:MAG: translation initiation factor IF-2, partial [Deltaproteobacteria bacterium HGW-Deltaproteobacteria-14]
AAVAEVAAPAPAAPEVVFAESNYTDQEAVNAGGITADTGRERQSFVKVVRRLDADLTQHLINEAQRRAQRSAGPPPRGPRPVGSPSGPRTGPPGPPRAGDPGAQAPPAAGADDRRKKGRRGGAAAPAGPGGGRVRWEASKDRRFDDRGSRRGKRGRSSVKKGVRITEGTAVPKASKRVVKMEETITVGELASQLAVKASEIIKALMDLGEMVTVNHVLDLDTVTLIAQEYEFSVENVAFDIENYIPKVEEGTESIPRDPVVTVMGHVDHGKTSLLDFIRKTRVAAGEAGGITQHIGAYKVPVRSGKNKRHVVFLDTPGHAAFTEMRARGANVTDIVILVVAADDGVMPQTAEAINHAKAAGVPVVVAVNKCDKPDAQPEKIRQQMTEYGLVSEEWGGETQFVNVSAKTGDGIDQLLDSVLLQADILELHAVVDRPATGVVIEAELSKGRGPVATVLVQEGTLRKGDIVVSGKAAGRVRAILDDRGRQIKEAGPAMPVEVLGLNEVPFASDRFFAVKDEKDARTIVNHLEDKEREKRLAEERKRVSLDDLFDQMKAGTVKTLHLIIKSDVQGSLEALKTAFSKLIHPELEVRIIHDAVGAISESDVNLAAASNAIIIGFNVRPEKNAKAMAEHEGVEIKLYSVIYNAVDDVKAAMEGMLSPSIEERLLGKAAIRDTFGVPKLGTIAGCAVLQGKLMRNARARLIRDSRVIADTKIDSLRRFKENVVEVDRGHECGAHLENYNDVKVGDEIECYELVEVAQKLDI